MTDRGLVDFLFARISEDEAVARAAFQPVGQREAGGWYWSDAGDAVFLDHTADAVACGPWQQGMHQPSARHIVRWDPERVVAECAVKRRLVERARGRSRTALLRELAAVYTEHADYRDDWRPRRPRRRSRT